MVEEADLPAPPLIVQTVVVTVAISVVAHGLTAPRGAAIYAAPMEGLRLRRPGAPELE